MNKEECSSGGKIRLFLALGILFMFGALRLNAGLNFSDTPGINSLMQEGFTVSGTVKDKEGVPIPGVNVYDKSDMLRGVVTDLDGKYTITASSDNAILVFSFIGFDTQEIPINKQSKIDVVLNEESKKIDEVVVVGYGTQKKVNVTGAVSVVKSEELEDRPVPNMQAALQGMAPNLNISASNGQPGSSMNMNIRGLTSFEGDASPYVLVDNIPMDINNVDPDDVESISVLKDAAASAIYGARAAYGVILITTKSGAKMKGKVQVNYSNNFSFTKPTIFPDYADPMSFAYAMNDAALNSNQNPYYTEDALDRLAQNIANPGSAVTMYAKTSDLLEWENTNGLGTAAVTDWMNIYWKNWSFNQKHNLNIGGGNDKIDYFFATNYFDQKGLMRYGGEYFRRFNLNANVNAQVYKWLKVNFIVKYIETTKDYPWDYKNGSGRVMDMVTKLKPTCPLYYPNPEDYPNKLLETTDVLVKESNLAIQDVQREEAKNHQLVFSPRLIFVPVKDWFINVDFNFRTNNSRKNWKAGQWYWLRPNNTLQYEPARESTVYDANMTSNRYVSPNIYTSYFKQLGDHYFKVLLGYQQEQYSNFDLYSDSQYLITDAVPSISTAVGNKTVDDSKGHWATQSFFMRVNYNYKEKYIAEVNFRGDGSSKFEPGHQWGYFPSFSLGYVLSNEKFFKIKNVVEYLKLRYSYGNLGNQNVANYLYIPTMGISLGTFLFEGQQAWTVNPPSLTSVDLTWEKVTTSDVGADLRFLNSRLTMEFDWYQSYTTDLVGPGEPLPAVLGTGSPKQNNGEIRIRGWGLNIAWKQTVKTVSYGFSAMVSDYKRVVMEYNNPTYLLSQYFKGQVMGDIWGFETTGYFQTQEEVDNWPIDQTYIWGGAWYPGDLKYVDQDNDGKISIGDNTLQSHGDKVILGNSTPRYSVSLSGNVTWKGFDLSILFQGVAKRVSDVRTNSARGPAQGPFHATAYKEHIDYWRDDSSPLGANPDAYYPKPYSENPGQNNKNWGYATNHFLQNSAYLRLKNLQFGYSLPKKWMEKAKIKKIRFYFGGENLVTFTKLRLFDPETIGGAIYPLSTVVSCGININF